MVQLNFRIPTQGDKDFINSAINDVADKFPSDVANRPSALKKICQIYFDGINTLEFKEIPASVTETIHAVQCEYLRWDGEIAVFICYESYHKSHKKHPIDSKHDKVLDACRLCKKGKSDAIRYRIEEGFRKKGINSIFNLTKLLLRMDIEGAVAQVFLCQAKQFTDDEIIISPDCVHLKCPQMDGELVLIEEHCITQIDPQSMNPPCEYLIAPFLRVPIKPAPEARAVMDEMKRLADESTNEEPQEQPKEVVSTVIEVEPDILSPAIEGIEETEPIEEIEPIDENAPTNARDIIAKENREKEELKKKKKTTKKKNGDK